MKPVSKTAEVTPAASQRFMALSIGKPSNDVVIRIVIRRSGWFDRDKTTRPDRDGDTNRPLTGTIVGTFGYLRGKEGEGLQPEAWARTLGPVPRCVR